MGRRKSISPKIELVEKPVEEIAEEKVIEPAQEIEEVVVTETKIEEVVNETNEFQVKVKCNNILCLSVPDRNAGTSVKVVQSRNILNCCDEHIDENGELWYKIKEPECWIASKWVSKI